MEGGALWWKLGGNFRICLRFPTNYHHHGGSNMEPVPLQRQWNTLPPSPIELDSMIQTLKVYYPFIVSAHPHRSSRLYQGLCKDGWCQLPWTTENSPLRMFAGHQKDKAHASWF